MANFGGELGAEGQGADGCVSGYQYPSGPYAAAVITSGGQPVSSGVLDDEDDGALKPLPERLVMELTAHRTLALREAIWRSSWQPPTDNAEESMTEALRDLARWLYRQLQAEAVWKLSGFISVGRSFSCRVDLGAD